MKTALFSRFVSVVCVVVITSSTTAFQYKSLEEFQGNKTNSEIYESNIDKLFHTDKLEYGRNLQKNQDFSALGVTTLKTAKSLHYQGEDVTFLFSSSANVPFRYYDWIKIIYANVTSNYYNAPMIDSAYLYDSSGSPSGSKSIFIDWEPGTYKGVMILQDSTQILAVSNSFQVLPETTSIVSNLETYAQSETIYLNVSTTNIPLRYNDLIRVIPANVSEKFDIAPYVCYTYLGTLSGSKDVIVPIVANWELGQYKAVLFLQDSSIVVAVSNFFNLTKLPVLVSTQKLTYFQGENIVVRFNNTRGFPSRPYDWVGIVYANVTDKFDQTKFISTWYLNEASGLPQGNTSFYSNMVVERYRAVFLLENSYIGAVSQVFAVKKNQIQLNTTKITYYQGSEIILKFKSLSGVPFRPYDWYKIIPANITKDYYNTPYVFWSYIYGASGRTFGNNSIFVNWMTGTYKAVFFLDGNNVVQAVSNRFNVKQNIIQLNSTKAAYYEGGTMALNFKSLSRVRFRSYDSIRIIPANITEDYYNVPYVFWEYIYESVGRTSGNKTALVNWKSGSYVAVFFLQDTYFVQAISNQFNILQNVIKLNSTKTSYYQSETLVLNFEIVSGVPFRYYDSIRIITANITEDYYNAPYVFVDYVYDTSGFFSGNKSILVNWKVGTYKAVFFAQGYTDAQAVSNNFTVMSFPAIVNLTKQTYFQGEDMVISYQNTRGVPFRYYDKMVVINSNVTSSFFWSAPRFLDDYLYHSTEFPNGTKSVVINWVPGKYRVVLFLQDSYEAVVSDVFEVRKNSVQVSSTKNSYFQGEYMVLQFRGIFNIPLRDYDTIQFYFSNVTEYRGDNVFYSEYLYAGGSLSFNKSFYVTAPVGQYKGVYFLNNFNVPFSNPFVFKHTRNVCTIKSRRSSYYQGETLLLDYRSVSGVPFFRYDEIRVISGSINSDYINAPYVSATTLPADGKKNGTASIFVNWEVGTYKALLVLQSTQIILAISSIFTVD